MNRSAVYESCLQVVLLAIIEKRGFVRVLVRALIYCLIALSCIGLDGGELLLGLGRTTTTSTSGNSGTWRHGAITPNLNHVLLIIVTIGNPACVLRWSHLLLDDGLVHGN